MKKLLIIFSCILMMFAIVACNQSGPEVKPDAFEEANQAIPSSNVDMNTAKDVTEDQSTYSLRILPRPGLRSCPIV